MIRDILDFFGINLGGERAPVVAVIRMKGVIGSIGGGRRGLTLQGLEAAIRKAFRKKKIEAVALVINSPGGSPVQSALIAERVRALAEEHEKPVYAFTEDVAASGGYWLACAGDEIYANPMSIVGSVGVISAGFGFVDAIEKLGVERRVYAAGNNKSMLDPFKPEVAKDIKRLKEIHTDIHGQFKDWVKERRGTRLNGEDKALFNGDIWTGNEALELGLIDGLGELRATMRLKYGEKVRFANLTPKQSRLPGFLGGAGETAPAGYGPAQGLIAAIEDRLWWSRYGL